MFSTTLENVDCWDEQLAKVMFGYKCGIQANIKFSPFMIMIRCTPRLRADNYLHSLTVVISDTIDVETTVEQFLQKMKLIASIHENILLNVERTQKKQKKRPMLPKKGSRPLKDWLMDRQWLK
jgi:hypothetical protein